MRCWNLSYLKKLGNSSIHSVTEYLLCVSYSHKAKKNWERKKIFWPFGLSTINQVICFTYFTSSKPDIILWMRKQKLNRFDLNHVLKYQTLPSQSHKTYQLKDTILWPQRETEWWYPMLARYGPGFGTK